MALKKTVGELVRQLGPDELRYWRAYDRIDPFGAERTDLGLGIVAATVANCHRSKDADPYKARDFMWEYKPPEESEAQTPERVAELIEQYFGTMAAMNAARNAPAPAEPYPLADEPVSAEVTN